MMEAFRRLLEMRRMLPESVFTSLLGFQLTPVLEYQGNIDTSTMLCYRLMKGIAKRNPPWAKYIAGPMEYYVVEDDYAEHQYMAVKPEFYLEYYHDKPEMIKEILHHHFCVLTPKQSKP